MHPGQPEENFDELLEEFMPSDIRQVIEEKESSSKRQLSLQEIIDQYPPVQEELNLHNETSEQAKDDIKNFIEHSHHKRLKTLRIITGKGRHSEGGIPILKKVALEKISELRDQGLVLSYKWEDGKMKKSGAIIVYLN